jgi:predicted metal-dependent HD superfamily phosphohydrolase
VHALQGRWLTDGGAALPGAGPEALAGVGADLVRRWAEPHRRYHDLTHLAEVLTAVDALSRAGGLSPLDRAAALLAAWFHDAVYSVGDPDANERSSAALAARSLAPLGAADGVVDRVVTLVLDTAGHDLDDAVEDPARLVLHDADLWILAAPVARFDEYCRQVRSEYEHVPAARYAAGRAAVLRPFLVRPHVYLTEHARRLWEPAARENLARELTRLAG